MAQTITLNESIQAVYFNSGACSTVKYGDVTVWPPLDNADTRRAAIEACNNTIYFSNGVRGTTLSVPDTLSNEYVYVGGGNYTFPAIFSVHLEWKEDYNRLVATASTGGRGWHMSAGSEAVVTRTRKAILSTSQCTFRWYITYDYIDIDDSSNTITINVNGHKAKEIVVGDSIPSEWDFNDTLGRETKGYDEWAYYRFVTWWDFDTDEFVVRLILKDNDDTDYFEEKRLARADVVALDTEVSFTVASLIEANRNALLACDNELKMTLKRPGISGYGTVRKYVQEMVEPGSFTESLFGTVYYEWDEAYEVLTFTGNLQGNATVTASQLLAGYTELDIYFNQYGT